MVSLVLIIKAKEQAAVPSEDCIFTLGQVRGSLHLTSILTVRSQPSLHLIIDTVLSTRQNRVVLEFVNELKTFLESVAGFDSLIVVWFALARPDGVPLSVI